MEYVLYKGFVVYNFMINSMNQCEICTLIAIDFSWPYQCSECGVYKHTNVSLRCFASLCFVCLSAHRKRDRASKDDNNNNSICILTLSVHETAAFHNTILIHLNGTNRFRIQYFWIFCVRVSLYFLFADDSTCVNAFFNCAFKHSHTLILCLFRIQPPCR